MKNYPTNKNVFIEELENICINNEYVLDLLAKLKNKETPEGNLIQSLTELCNKYCENCPVTYAPNDCTDCLITHIRRIMNGYISVIAEQKCRKAVQNENSI